MGRICWGLALLSCFALAGAYIDDGRCQRNEDCRHAKCCSPFGWCGNSDKYCKDRDKEPTDCKKQFPSMQFENIWQKDLLDLAENGFAKKFGNRKFKSTKFGGRVKVAIIGSGPAGLTVAYELAKFAVQTKSNLEITIIEKDNRIGGRIKTVGKAGHFLPNIWKGEALTDAGAMRLPLTPQSELDCKYKSKCASAGINCDVGKMSDAEIQHLVHGTGGYDFIEAGSFPHFLIRHYIKKFRVPVFRHNMRQTAHEILGKLFVRNEENQFICRKCGGGGEDLNIDQHVLTRVERVEPAFAAKLRRENNGSLSDAFEKAVDDEVIRWVDKYSVIMETDHSKMPEKLKAWRQFEDDWALTYRDHLKKKNWPENVIDIYETAYQCLTQYRIREDIIETTIGKWWQKNAMFSLRQGMHALFQKPDSGAKTQTAFYDEILKMAKENWNLSVKFMKNTRVEKMEKKTGGRVTLWKNAAPAHALWDRIDAFDAVVSTIPPQFIRAIDIRVDGLCITPAEGLFEDDPLFKMMLQFRDPFWLDPTNNKGGFHINDEQGFLTSTDAAGKLRYPRRTGEPGNIIMMYVFHENADAFAHKLTQQGYMQNATANWKDGEFDQNSGAREVIHMALEQLQRFHPNVDILKKFTGNYFIQPWVQLSKPPSGYHQMTKVQKYCDASPEGLYFAGDGFSFKPQWIDGALYTSYHALFRLINDLTESRKEDPFKTLLDVKDYIWM